MFDKFKWFEWLFSCNDRVTSIGRYLRGYATPELQKNRKFFFCFKLFSIVPEFRKIKKISKNLKFKAVFRSIFTKRVGNFDLLRIFMTVRIIHNFSKLFLQFFLLLVTSLSLIFENRLFLIICLNKLCCKIKI